MDPEVYKFVLSVVGILLIGLFTIIGYLIKQWLERSSQQMIQSNASLTEAVNELTTAVALLKNNQGNSEKFCSQQHKVIDTRLNDHSKTLKEHSAAIVELQTITPNKITVKKNQS
jgi:ABC-type bacteriocin/lantibiotic exporter with double-glycine peptidase domain